MGFRELVVCRFLQPAFWRATGSITAICLAAAFGILLLFKIFNVMGFAMRQQVSIPD